MDYLSTQEVEINRLMLLLSLLLSLISNLNKHLYDEDVFIDFHRVIIGIFFVVISWGKIIKKRLRPFIIFEAMCFSRESSKMEIAWSLTKK